MPTRRTMLKAASLACGSALAGHVAQLAAQEATAAAGQAVGACLDYGRSFVRGTASFNAVRFWIESRTTVVDDKSGGTSVYYQCASCKSENTFAARNLFPVENYDFLPVLGDGRWLIFRRHAHLNDDYRQVRSVEESWGTPEMILHFPEQVTPLATWEQIRDATAAGLPIVGRTELTNVELGLRGTIEFPVKTMNVSLDKRLYQIDTGPVALPDLERRYDEPLEALRLAFVAFNAADFADFVIEQPTAIGEEGAAEEGTEPTRVYHYSGPISLRARNELLALGAL